MSYSLKAIDGIDEEAIKALKACGIRTADKLLEAAKDAKGRQTLAAETGLDAELLLRWANARDRMRVKGVGRETSELLREAGVKTVRDLKHRNAEKLQRAIAEANCQRRLLRTAPSLKQVTGIIERAKRLPIKITY